jgi:hypothetical protein
VYALLLSVNAQDYPPTKSLDVQKINPDLITVDGYADEDFWSQITAVVPEFVACGGTNDAYPDASSHAASYKVAWSSVGFHLFVEVTDDANIEYEAVEGLADWQCDAVEIFFYAPADWGPTHAGEGFWGEGCAQIRFSPMRNDVIGGRVGETWGPFPDAVGTTLPYALEQSSSGYTLEATITWEFLGIKPDDLMDEVRTMGWEIAFADGDDPAVGRTHCLTWNQSTENDQAWQNVDFMGDAVLLNASTIGVNPLDNEFQVNFYVANNVLYLSESLIGQELTIMNLAGQDIFNTEITSAKIALSDLNQGLYLVKIGDDVRKIMVQ